VLRILQTSDWHLRDTDIREGSKCLDFMADRAEAESPDLIVIAGDFFDARGVKMESDSAKLAFRIVSRLADIAPVVGVIGTNSHDGSAPEILANVRAEHQVVIASKPMMIGLKSGKLFIPATSTFFPTFPDAIISLVPQPTKQWMQGNGTISQGDQQVGQAMAGIFAGFGAGAAEFPTAVHILCGHGQIVGSKKSEKQVLTGNDIEITRGQLELAQADLIAYGHIHFPQEVFPGCFYSSSIYAKDHGENHPHGFYLHTLDCTMNCGEDDARPRLTDSKLIETPTRRFFQVKTDLQEDLANLPIALPSPDQAAGAIVRLELKAWQDQAGEIDREALKKAYMDAGAESVEIKITRVPRETVRSEKIIHCTTLSDKIVEMARLRGEEVPPGVLEKAQLLESETPEKILAEVAG